MGSAELGGTWDFNYGEESFSFGHVLNADTRRTYSGIFADPVISISDARITESNGTYSPALQFVVTLSEPSLSNITIDYQSISGTAIEGSDYIGAKGTLTIAAGATSGIISVTTYGYSEVEFDESFVLELTNPSGAVFADGVVSLRATGTILDNDGGGGKRALFVDDIQIIEGDAGQREAVFQVRLSQAPTEILTLDFTTTDGSAVAGVDYLATSGILTFTPGGALIQQVVVPIIGDLTVEGTETFSLTVTPTAAIASGAVGASGIANILDDDAGDGTVPVISVTAATEVAETNGTYSSDMQFVVTLSQASATDIYIDYQTLSGTANEGSDFIAQSGTLLIPAGDTSGVIAVTTYGYSEIEADENFILQLTNPQGAVFAGEVVQLQAQGVLIDNDGTGNKLALLVSDALVVEGDSGQRDAVFEVRLSQPSNETITLTYTTRDATALAGSDYVPVAGTVTFLPGETVKAVTVAINGDTVVEGSEQFVLLVNPSEAIGNGVDGAQGIATILDDDAGSGALPVLSVAAAEVAESNGTYSPNMQFVVTLSSPATTDVRVNYQTVSGSSWENHDFIQTRQSGTLVIAAGESSGVIEITTYGYSDIEADENFILQLSNPQGAVFAGNALQLQAQAITLDNDGSTPKLALVVSDAQVVEGDSGTTEAVFEVRLSRPVASDVTVEYTTLSGSAQSGEDFAPTTGTITFLAGQTLAAVHVPVYGDTAIEASEQFSLVLSAPQGAVFGAGAAGVEATATILDDDASSSQPVISIADAKVLETNGTYSADMEFVVTLSAPSTQTVQVAYTTVNGSALSGSDYIAQSGTVTFAPGQTSAVIAVTTYGYSVVEPDETFSLQLSNPQNAVLAGGVETLSATGTIIDNDDAAPVDGLPILSVADIQVQEASGGSTATFTLNLSSPSASTISGDFSVTGGTATAGADFTPVAGNFSFVPGQTSVTVQVAIAEDAVIEPTETIVLRLENLENAQFSNFADQLLAIGEILDQGNLAPVAQPDQFSTDEDTAITGSVLVNNGNGADSDANGDTLTVTAVNGVEAHVGQSIALASGALLTLNANGAFSYNPNGQFDELEAGDLTTDTFTYTISDGNGGQSTATATANINGINDAPVGIADTFTTEENTVINGNVFANNGNGADYDPEGDAMLATLGEPAANGTVVLNPDGSFVYTPTTGFVGTDTFTYTLSDGQMNSDPITVTLNVNEDMSGSSSEFDIDVIVPDSLAPGTPGLARIDYERVASDSGMLNAAIIFVTAEGGLVKDPLTGHFEDQLFLLAYGDGINDIVVGETGTIEFEVKGTCGPNANYTVNASTIDFDAVIDWESNIDQLRPTGISDSAWESLSTQMVDRLGSTGGDFANTLAEFGLKMQSLGLNGESASAALAFLAEVVGDFGSIASRADQGSMGQGWATIADIGLAFEGDTVIFEGLPDLALLRSFNPSQAAYYSISESASRGATLAGSLVSDGPLSGIQFVKTEIGTYVAASLADVSLVKSNEGYEVRYPDGAQLLFDNNGDLLKLVEADGREITVSRNGEGAISGFAGPQGAELSFIRNIEGNIETIVDGNGSSVSLIYDTEGRFISATSVAGTAQFGYDTFGNLTSAQAPGIDAIQISYDADLRLFTIDYADGLQSETFSYDGLGGVTLTDGEGRSTSVEYLPGGVVGRATDSENNSSELIFDEDGNLVGIRAPDGSETTITFDELGRMTSLTDANGATVYFNYEGDSDAPVSFTDASGSTRSFFYDDGGRITDAEWSDGTSLEFDYDANGNLVTSENRRGESIEYAYDSSGRLIAQTDGSSGAVAYNYDQLGRLTSAVDERGITSFEYDDAGRITLITYPEGRSLAYTYNEAGLRTSMTDHSGDALFYEYDGLGRLIGLDDKNGAIVDYTYDTAGNLVREENGNGTVSTFSYDDAGRLTEIVNAQSDGTVNSFYRYTYDAAGQRVEMASHDGTWTYGYDAIGQLASADFSSINPDIVDKSLVYEYDDAGNRTRVVEDGVETLYTTNDLNQYTTVGDATFIYDDDGNMVSKSDSSGTTTYEYDLNNRLVRVVEADGTVHEHEYGVLGNRVATTTDGARTEFLLDPFGFGNVVGDYAADGARSAEYIYGLGLTMAEIAGAIGFYDIDGVGSVTTTTKPDGTVENEYTYSPFGTKIYEREATRNSFEFNGGMGISEDASGLTFMRARSYSSELGRFLSEDPIWVDGSIWNLYNFAGNNPVLFVDPLGEKQTLYFDRDGNYYTKDKEGNLEPYAVEVEHNYNQTDEGSFGQTALTVLQYADAYATTAHGLFSIGIGTYVMLFPGAQLAGAALIAGGVAISANGLRKFKNALEGTFDPESDNGQNDDADNSDGHGDPWITSFDGNGTFFNAYGEFVYARSADGEFEVQARQLPVGGNHPSITSIYAVATRVDDHKVEIQWAGASQSIVMVNGNVIEIEAGETIAIGDGSICRGSATSYVVSNGLGDGMAVVIGSAYMNVFPFIDPSRAGAVEGVHGNYDGDPSNDFALPDGTVLGSNISFQELYTTFADAWRVTNETSLFTYLVDRGTEDFTNLNFPRGLVRLEDLDPAAVAAAHAAALAAGLQPGTWLYETTVFDIALTGDISYAETAANSPAFAFTSPDGTQDEIVVADIDAPPILDGDATATASEDGTVTIDVLASASDPEGNPLTLVSGSDPNGGTVTVEDGKLVFAPAPNFAGETIVTYIVRDEAGNEVEGKVTVTVVGTPDAPVAQADSFETNESTPVTGDVLADNGAGADSDVDGDALTVTEVNRVAANVGSQITLASGALLTLNADGSFIYDPNGQFEYLNAGESTSDSFEYTISDGQGGVDTQTVTLSIAGITGLSLNAGTDASQAEGSTFSRLITFNDGQDANGDGWTYEVDWGDGSPVETGSTTNTSFTISRNLPDGAASQTVTVTVFDGAESISQSFELSTTNVVPAAPVTGADVVAEGALYTLNVGAITDPGADTRSDYSIDWGDGTVETLTSAEWSAAAGSFTHIYADGGSTGTDRTVIVSATDEDGTFVLGSKSLTVSNVVPAIALAGADSVDEGALYTLILGAITDPGVDTVTDYIIHWGDGTSDTVAASGVPPSGEITHTYSDGPATPTIVVDLVDEDGTHLNAGTLNLSVNNVAPTISLSGSGTITAGQLYTLSLSDVVDPGDDTIETYIIDWGDGTSDTIAAASLPASGELTHTFANAGDVTISIDLVDEDGTYVDMDTLALTVEVPPDGLSLNAGTDASLSEGSTFSRLITFSDGEDASGDGWTYEVNWGDGTPVETGSTTSTSFTISRDLPDGANSQTVTVTVFDGVDSVSESFALTTTNVAPVIALSGAADVDEGTAYTLTLGAITDPGVDSVADYIVHWGDGTTETIAAASVPPSGQITHIYSDGPVTPIIVVDLVDEDGTHLNAGVLNLTVNNVAPTIVISGADSADEGSTYTLDLGTIVEPGDDAVSLSVDWGDGNVEAISAGTTSIDHVFADGAGAPTITVTVTDSDGASTQATKLVTINNVAPTLTLNGNSSTTAGQLYTLILSDVIDPGTDTVSSYIIDWGDGTSDTIAAADLPANGELTHTFASAGSVLISIDLVDEDGTYVEVDTHALTVEVAPDGLSLNAGGDASVAEGNTFSRLITFSDGEDTNGDGWTYEINWGDGSPVETGTTTSTSFNISRNLPDGANSQTVSVTVFDGVDSVSESFELTTTNVAPTIAISGADSVDEGSTYTLNLEGIVDPGTDTHSLTVDWGDGTALQAIAVGTTSLDHVFTDGASSPIITVTVTDSDGASTTASKPVTVNNVAPTISLGGSSTITVGQLYTLILSDVIDPGQDAVSSYIIDWGDGTTDTIAAADLPANGELTHIFANVGDVTISIDLVDEDGTYVEVDTLALAVTAVENQAPTAQPDSFTITEDELLSGNLLSDNGSGVDSDPDGDALGVIAINGQAGSVGGQIVLASGALLTASANGAIAYDPNGQFDALNAGETASDSFEYTISDGRGGTDTQTVTINILGESEPVEPVIVRLGDAPDRLPRDDRFAWENAWTDDAVAITHKANATNGAEAWSQVVLTGSGGTVLAGGDIRDGDLGVSGSTQTGNGYVQELGGTEALRFDLQDTATKVTLDLTRFYFNDDGQGHSESVRLQAFDDQGNLVEEALFTADSALGESAVSFDVEAGFSELVVTSGAYDGDEFVFGGLADSNGLFATGNNNTGSEFMIEAIEFEFGPVQAPAPQMVSTPVSAFAVVNDLELVADSSDELALVIGVDDNHYNSLNP